MQPSNMANTQSLDNGESQERNATQGVHYSDLIDMRQKSLNELKACVKQPNSVFVAVHANRMTKAESDGLRVRNIDMAFMDSEDFFKNNGQTRRFDQFIETHNIEMKPITTIEPTSTTEITTPDEDFIPYRDAKETLVQFLRHYKKTRPRRNLILVGYGLQPVIDMIQRELPGDASLFSDAIDTAWPIWTTVPYNKYSTSKDHMLKALYYELDSTDGESYCRNSAAKTLALLVGLNYLTNRQASWMEMGTAKVHGNPVPRLYVGRGSNEHHLANILPTANCDLPDEIDSTVKLANFITGLGHSAVKVGTWDACYRAPFNTRLDIRESGRKAGWACFSDEASLKDFAASARASDLGRKTVIRTYGTPESGLSTLREIRIKTEALEEQRNPEALQEERRQREEMRRWRDEYVKVHMEAGPVFEQMGRI